MRQLECLSLEVPRCGSFQQIPHENLRKGREAIRKEILVCLIKLARLHVLSQVLSTGYFPFLVGYEKDSERNKGFRSFREAFIQRAWKQSEHLVLRVVPDEEFLHTKINNKNVYVYYGATENIPEDRCSLRQYKGTFESIELKQVIKVLEIKENNYQKVSIFFKLSQQVSFDLFIFLFLGFGRNPRFLQFHSQLQQATWLCLVQLFYLSFFRSLTEVTALQCYVDKLVGKNSQINLLTLIILTSLGLFLIMNFIADFYQLGLIHVYNNDKTVKKHLGKNFVHLSE